MAVVLMLAEQPWEWSEKISPCTLDLSFGGSGILRDDDGVV